jgi:hypothetical protein
LVPAAFEQALAFATENQQPVVWDRAERPWAIALYDSMTKRLRALTDEEAATLLNRDPLIAREWRKYNALTSNNGSLVVLDIERARRVLAASADEDEIEGLA